MNQLVAVAGAAREQELMTAGTIIATPLFARGPFLVSGRKWAYLPVSSKDQTKKREEIRYEFPPVFPSVRSVGSSSRLRFQLDQNQLKRFVGKVFR